MLEELFNKGVSAYVAINDLWPRPIGNQLGIGRTDLWVRADTLARREKNTNCTVKVIPVFGEDETTVSIVVEPGSLGHLQRTMHSRRANTGWDKVGAWLDQGQLCYNVTEIKVKNGGGVEVSTGSPIDRAERAVKLLLGEGSVPRYKLHESIDRMLDSLVERGLVGHEGGLYWWNI